KCRLRDLHLLADLLNRRPALCLPQRKGNLFLRKPLPFHGIRPPWGSECPKKLPSTSTSFLGQDQSWRSILTAAPPTSTEFMLVAMMGALQRAQALTLEDQWWRERPDFFH